MEENILFLINSRIKKEIEFKSFGIKIRNIYKEEIDYIKKEMNKVYNSKELKLLFSKYIEAKDNNSLTTDVEKLKEYNETLKTILELDVDTSKAFYYLEANNGRFDTSQFKKIKNCIVAEVNEEKFKKCFGDLDKQTVILKLLLFTNYLQKEDSLKNKINYSVIKDFKYFEDLLKYSYKDNNLDIQYLDKVATVLNKKDINFNISFFFIIENLIFNNMSLESKIVNFISVLEKILIKKGENKQQSFILKVGILIKEHMPWSNEKIADVLKSVYEVRSHIVHGEEEKIYEEKDKFINIFEKDKLSILKDKTGIRNEIFLIVSSYLELITKTIINRYIDDTEFCEYLRMN